MDWKKVGEQVGKVAPLLGGVLLGSPGSALGSMVASALGVENTPDAVTKAIASNPEAAAKLKELEENNQHQLSMMLLQLEKTGIEQQAMTQRKELESHDPFVRRWRPLFGYIMAVSFFFLNLAICWMIVEIVNHPESISPTVTALSQVMGPVSIIWSMGMAILGISIRERSKDKKTEKGMDSGTFSGFVNMWKAKGV